MPTFQANPETVDARQFKGGVQNGTDLILWVQSNSIAHRGAYLEELPGRRHERLVITTHERHVVRSAFVEDWIVQRQSGKFEVMRPQEFEEKFFQV